MTTSATPDQRFRDYTEQKLKDAGFATAIRELPGNAAPIVLAESPYYFVAFQVFGQWEALHREVWNLEAAVSHLLESTPGSHKVWDAYLLMACRADIDTSNEFNEFAELTYNVRATRKMISVGVQEDITRLDPLLSSFVRLTDARVSAKDRDPLKLLEDSMIASGIDPTEAASLFEMYRSTGRIIDG